MRGDAAKSRGGDDPGGAFLVGVHVRAWGAGAWARVRQCNFVSEHLPATLPRHPRLPGRGSDGDASTELPRISARPTHSDSPSNQAVTMMKYGDVLKSAKGEPLRAPASGPDAPARERLARVHVWRANPSALAPFCAPPDLAPASPRPPLPSQTSSSGPSPAATPWRSSPRRTPAW